MYSVYVKEVLDFIRAILNTTKQSDVLVKYSFSDYQPSRAKQMSFLKVLEQHEVLEFGEKHEMVAVADMFVNLYGKDRCTVDTGYDLQINRDAFQKYCDESGLIIVTEDENGNPEHKHDMPYLSEDGETLYLSNGTVEVGLSAKRKTLMGMIFANEEHSCSAEDFARASGEKAMQDPARNASNIVNQMNTAVLKQTGMTDLLEYSNGVISLHHRFFD